MKKGFTMIEILVAMVIMVMVFALLTVLYVRASKIRRIITAQNEVQGVLSQMMDTIIHGKKAKWGLVDATNIRSITDSSGSETVISPYTLVAYNETTDETMVVRIASEEELKGSGDTVKTLWINWYNSSSPPSSFYTNEALIDINKKIELTNNSCFSYYDSGGRNILDEGLNTETTLVKITLKGKSTEPAMKNMTPVTLHSAVRLRNKLSF